MRRRFLSVRMLVVRLGFAFGRRRPLRSQVVLATSHDTTIRGNLAILAEGLAATTPPTPVVIQAYRTAPTLRSRLAGLRHLWRAGYLLATSRVTIVDDFHFPIYVVTPRPGTTVIQAWHGCGAFKRFGYSVLDKSFGADESYVQAVAIHRNYDVCLVSSMAVAPAYAEAFRQPLSIFRSDFGIPRTDVLFGDERIARIVADLRHRYAIPAGKRVVLYAPTFRGDTVTAARADGLPDWLTLRDALADDHILLVRLHPFVRESLVIDRELDGFLTDVSDHPDINELLHLTDVLVTDYSSVIYEFALLGRPMVFYAPDLADYEGERGFYFDYRTGVPGPVVETTEALAAAVRDPAPDVGRVEAFARANFDVADGHATARVIDRLIRPALKGATLPDVVLDVD